MSRPEWRTKLRAFAAVALLVGCCSVPVHATTLTVPDQVPTIQAAVDALVDTILVRAGAYPETVVVLQSFSLMAAADPSGERPAIAGLTIRVAPVMFRDLQFDTRITVISGYRDDIGFVRCDLREGVVDTGELRTNNFTLFKCLLGGSITPAARWLVLVDSCQVTGHVSVRQSPDCVLRVVGSTFQGDGTSYGVWGHGIAASSAVGNTVREYVTGISIGGQEGGSAYDNLVEDCSGVGLIAGGGYSGYVVNNVVRRCGRGIEGGGERSTLISGNTVSECTGTGLKVYGESFAVVGNVVSRSGGDGIFVSMGTGTVMQNTSCLNGGSGFMSNHYYDFHAAEFTRNVGYGNGSYGIEWWSTEPATVTCNDWYANQAGASGGRPPSAEDFSVDPQFCGPQTGDFHLQADSPLLDLGGCGQVGALGIGCATTGVEAEARQEFSLVQVGPSPGGGPVRISFALAREGAIEIGVFDVQGRKVASVARGVWPAGTHELVWDGRTRGGNPAPAGMYVVRYVYPGGREARRVVHVR